MQVQSTALIFHEVNTGPGDRTLSVVAHDVLYREQQSPVMGAGKVLDTEAKAKILQVLNDDVQRSPEFIEPATLFQDRETLVWYRVRQKTRVCLDGHNLSIPVPSLVFMLHRGHLYVRAYKGERRPSPDTHLICSGLPNLYANGSWCAGGNRLPERPSQRHMADVEGMFFESPFTHDGSERPINGGGLDWLRSLEGKPRFPIRQLPGTRHTLMSWIKEVRK